MKHLSYFILLVLTFSCSSTKDKVEKNKLGFTEFYKVLFITETKQKIYTLADKKLIDIKIINNGTKDLFVPKWPDMSSGKNSELYIEIYKKNQNGKYEVYEQKSKIVTTNRQVSTYGREVLSVKNGASICFSNIELDSYLKIVDKGEFLAKLSIDLSNFGYFKILETTLSFEVR